MREVVIQLVPGRSFTATLDREVFAASSSSSTFARMLSDVAALAGFTTAQLIEMLQQQIATKPAPGEPV